MNDGKLLAKLRRGMWEVVRNATSGQLRMWAIKYSDSPHEPNRQFVRIITRELLRRFPI